MDRSVGQARWLLISIMATAIAFWQSGCLLAETLQGPQRKKPSSARGESPVRVLRRSRTNSR